MSGGAEQTVLPARDAEAETQSGIFPAQGLEGLIETGLLAAENAILPEQIQPASIDLRLGATAYRVPASFLPGTRTVEDKLGNAYRVLSTSVAKIVRRINSLKACAGTM